MKRIDREIEQARLEAISNISPIEPTEEEKRAGWDTESLTAYIAERNAAASLQIDANSMYRRNRQHEQNHRYNPHRWRA